MEPKGIGSTLDFEILHALMAVLKRGTIQSLENKKIKTYFIRISSRPRIPRPQISSRLTPGSYLFTPFQVNDGVLKVTFLGTSRQLKEVLKSLEIAKTRFEIVSMTDAGISPSSPLQRLTEKQREVLILAYK